VRRGGTELDGMGWKANLLPDALARLLNFLLRELLDRVRGGGLVRRVQERHPLGGGCRVLSLVCGLLWGVPAHHPVLGNVNNRIKHGDGLLHLGGLMALRLQGRPLHGGWVRGELFRQRTTTTTKNKNEEGFFKPGSKGLY